MIKQIVENNAGVKPNTKKLEALREYFPGCFTAEGTFDIERFRDVMKDEVDITSEGYSLDFLGKDYANLIASIDTTTVIEPDLEHNAKPENKDSENVYISGDNLDALKHLLKSYAGQVRCIYIDPPYNTGSDGFVYKDDFNFSVEQLESKLSIEEEEAKRILDLTSRNSCTHSAWLMFMSPRLQLARDLLSKDGVIFISIDDNEQANLKLLCDYVFGEENFVAQFIWEKRKTRENRSSISVRHDYILCYVKDSNLLEDAFGLELMNDEAISRYKNPDNDPKGPWTSVPAIAQAGHGTKNQFYSFVAPNGKTYNPPSGSCWRLTLDKMNEAIANNKIWFGSDSLGVPRIKKYLSEGKQGLTPESIISAEKGGTNDSAKREIVELFDGIAVFETPKPSSLVKHLITMSSEDVWVLDFFSGSATTAHAVMQKNLEDGGHRKFVLVQIPELIAEDKEAYKAGYRTIDEIGQERIKRAAAKLREENPLFAGDLGFQHYTLREVPQNVLDKMMEFDPNVSAFGQNMLEMFGRETVLETWKVRDGYGMNAKVEGVKLADYTAWQCGDHLYLTDEGMSDEAITALVDKYGKQDDWGPHYVVVFGYSFNFGTLQGLTVNLPLLSEGEKQIKINIDIRY